MCKSNQPKIEIKKSTFESNLDIVSVFFVFLQFAIIFLYWSKLPEKIPTHFNFSGEPDSWSGKNSIFILPVISIVLFSFMTILSSYPHTFNYLFKITEKNAFIQYRLVKNYMAFVKASLMMLFFIITFMIAEISTGSFMKILNYFLYLNLVLIFIATTHYIIKSLKAK